MRVSSDSRPARRRLDRAVPWLVSLLAAASLAGWLGAWSWQLDLFSHFRVQYALAALVLALAALWRRQPVIAAMAGLLAAANGAEVVRVGAFPPTAAAATAPGTLKILSLNLWNRNRDTDRVLDYLRRTDADVVVLNETVPHWVRALDALADRYPYRHDRADCREFKLCEATILSKRPWRAAGDGAGGVGRLPLVWATFDVNGTALTVAGTHMLYSLTSSSARKQRAQIEDLVAFVRAHPGPLVVAGDFNATPWSAVHDRLVENRLDADLAGVAGLFRAARDPHRSRVPRARGFGGRDQDRTQRRFRPPAAGRPRARTVTAAPLLAYSPSQ